MKRLHLLAARFLKVMPVLTGILLFLGGPMGVLPCAAHPGNIASVLAKVQADGTFTLHFRFDLLAYVAGELPNRIGDGPMNALLDGSTTDLERQLTDAKNRFRQSIRANGSGPEAIDRLTFPNANDVLQSVKNVRLRLPVMASVIVAGHLPPGTKTVRFQFDETLGAVVLTTEFPYQEPFSEPVDAGAFSSEQTLPSADSVARAAVSAEALEAAPAPKAQTKADRPAPTKALSLRPAPKAAPTPRAEPASMKPLAKPITAPAAPVAPALAPFPMPTLAASVSIKPYTAPKEKAIVQSALLPLPTPRPSALSTAATHAATTAQKPTPADAPPVSARVPQTERKVRPLLGLTHFIGYIKMGYTHILPEGVDHILFVLGLFLLTLRIKPLLLQITAFTVAHSLSLALSLYGIVHLPSTIVEPIIAASIVFVAVENLFTKEMKPWRPLLVFGFGLIHGLGFAAALQEIGLQRSNFLTALVGFNVGVELGQLSVVALAFLLVGWFRNRPGYRAFVVIPGSLIIALVALFWTFQRIFLT